MHAHSLIAQTPADLGHQLVALTEQGFTPTLGIVFATPEADTAALMALFGAMGIDILGCTTAGEIHDETLHEDAIAVLLMDVAPSAYKLIFEPNTEGVVQTGQKVRAIADATFENPALIVATSGVLNDGEAIVEGLKMGKKPNIPIFGGLAGDNLKIQQTLVFSTQQISDDAFAAIVFDNDRIEITGLATSGWEPLGTFNTVTKAEGNVIYTIENEPALDFFIRFFGYHDNANVKDRPISTISAQYPLQVMRDGDAYAVLRSPILGDEEKRSLHLVGKIKEGDKFRFSIAPGVEVIEQTVEEFQQFKVEVPAADALILFSCKGRHAALGPFLEDEVKGIYDLWQKPMIGFLTYGEIGNVKKGACEFHNETCSLVLIREK